MAEQGTAVEEKPKEGTTGGTEVISQADADKVFETELQRHMQAEGKKTTAPEAGKEGAKEQKPEGAAPDAGTLKADEPAPSKEATDQAAKEEAEFLKSMGFDGVTVPKELLPTLKKMKQEFDVKLNFEQTEKRRWGDQNKQLSEQLKTLKGEHGKLVLTQPITVDEVKAFREKHKSMIASLPEGAKRLWEDDDYVADKIATLRFMESGNAGAGQPGSAGEPRPEASAQAPTEEQAKQVIAQNMSRVISSDVIKSSYPKIGEIYSSKPFLDWITDPAKVSAYEMHKIYSDDPLAHKELLDRYHASLAFDEMQSTQAKEKLKKQDALGGPGDVSRGGRTVKDETPNDILTMSDEDYEKRKSLAFARSGG